MKSCGIIVGGYAKISSLRPFKEVDVNQINGNIDNNEVIIKTECMDIFEIIFF